VADAHAKDLIPTTDRFGAALGDIVRCPACSHMQLDRFPTEAELGEAYGEAASEDYVEQEAGQRETARIALEHIESFVEPGAILDLGCWVGFLLAVARDRGWDTLGVEPSEFASAYARDRLGLEIIRDDLFDADLGGRRFEAVVMGDVLEHLSRPADAVDRMAELVAPGGVAYLALPNAGSVLARRMGARWWSVVPTHVQYFTRASLLTLLRRRDWEPLWVGTAAKAFTVGYYLERVGGYSRPLSKALGGTAGALGLGDRMWAPDFRDRMAVIARAPAR
jgi:SAM-dependent methyltransferase